MHREGPFRLVTGGDIDRLDSVRFRFDDRVYLGYGGDTLASD
jgi:hypothetical protein